MKESEEIILLTFYVEYVRFCSPRDEIGLRYIFKQLVMAVSITKYIIVHCKERDGIFLIIINVCSCLNTEFFTPYDGGPPVLLIKEYDIDTILRQPPCKIFFNYQPDVSTVIFLGDLSPCNKLFIPVGLVFAIRFSATGIDKDLVIRIGLYGFQILSRNVCRASLKSC